MTKPWHPRVRMAAERATIKRMGRERLDEGQDDEAWDEEFGRALDDELCDHFDRQRDEIMERRRDKGRA